MVTFQIGRGEIETAVAYPASVSFVHFVIESYGIEKLKELYQLESRAGEEKQKSSFWKICFEKSLSEIEKVWLNWLKQR